MIKKLLIILLCSIPLFVVSCASDNDKNLAPVVDGWRQPNAHGGYHVAQGDTLYSIAWRYGLDYRELAKVNHIPSPYAIHQGQILSLAMSTITTTKVAVQKPVSAHRPIVVMQKKDVKTLTPPRIVSNVAPTKTITVEAAHPDVSQWQWPAIGHIINNFASANGMNKGIDIAGKLGEPVKAAAAGKVVYCGSGLRGYGNLIIVKHNDEFLSAYAHNNRLLVHEGQQVKASEVIAEIGNSEANRVMLHFEIRRAGKPVDPLNYLAAR